MKTLFFLLLLCANAVFAQNTEYLQILQRGKDALRKEDYQGAILKYRAAEAADPSKKEEVNVLIDAVFVAIEQKRVQAEEAKKRAEKAEKAATEAQKATKIALIDAQKAQKATKIALSYAEKSQEEAQTALDKAQKLVDAFYFYDGKFALAYGKIGYYNKFYFIDKKGDKVEKLGEWDKAEQFPEYSDGFTKVWKDQQEHYLDTMGNYYRVAYKLEDLNAEIKALDLIISDDWADSLFSVILTHPQLEVLILNADNAEMAYQINIPEEISNLGNLKVIKSDGITLRFPKRIGELKDLEILKATPRVSLGEAFFSDEIGQLSNLKQLDLSSNYFNNLPYSIGGLKNLRWLDLNNNQLRSLPSQIGELENLRWLNLGSNQLIILPSQIGELKNLRWLNLTENDSLDWKNMCNILSKFSQKTLFSLEAKEEQESILWVQIDSKQIFQVLENASFSQIEELKNLPSLDLNNNQLTLLPAQIGELNNLQTLDLFANQLRLLPSQIGELKNLQSLDLRYNDSLDLASVCVTFANFPKKIILSTKDNASNDEEDVLLIVIPKQSSLPSQIGELKNLQTLDLKNNQLSSLPAQIGKLKNLKKLNLSNNPIPEAEQEKIRKLLPNCEVVF